MTGSVWNERSLGATVIGVLRLFIGLLSLLTGMAIKSIEGLKGLELAVQFPWSSD